MRTDDKGDGSAPEIIPDGLVNLNLVMRNENGEYQISSEIWKEGEYFRD